MWVGKAAAGAQFDNVIAVAAGDIHAAAIVKSATEDSTVWCWGAQLNGRLGNGLATALDVKSRVRVNLPSGSPLIGIIAIACGGKHTRALDKQGRVWSWGFNTSGQLNRTPGASTPAKKPALIVGTIATAHFVEIAAVRRYRG